MEAHILTSQVDSRPKHSLRKVEARVYKNKSDSKLVKQQKESLFPPFILVVTYSNPLAIAFFFFFFLTCPRKGRGR
jgi:hypothetical protein